MKYLKTYSDQKLHCEMNSGRGEITSSRIPDGVVKDLKDICLDLTDKGFLIYIVNDLWTGSGIGKRTSPYMTINKGVLSQRNTPPATNYGPIHSGYLPQEFTYTQEMDDIVERIKDYMSSEGFVVELMNYFYKSVGSSVSSKNHLGKKYYQITMFFHKKDIIE